MIIRHPFLLSLAIASSTLAFGETIARGSMDLYSYPPIHKISWSRPRSAMTTIILSTVKKNFLQSPAQYVSLVGHAMVRIRCHDRDGVFHEDWVGLTGQNDPAVDKQLVFKDQVGLGALFYDYVDGTIDSDEKSRFQITNYRGRRRFVFSVAKPEFLRVRLDPEDCSRVVQMAQDLRSIAWNRKDSIAELSQKSAGEVLGFGFNFDPYKDYLRWLESAKTTPIGGGCASMAVAFLKRAGAHHPLFEKRWTQTLDIGESRIGDPKSADGPDDRVSVLALFGRLGSSWKSRNEESRHLNFYDPELMWSHVRSLRRCAEGSFHCSSAARADLELLQSQGVSLEGRRESFENVQRQAVQTASSKGSYRPARARVQHYQTTVIRRGIELDGI